MLDFGSMLMLAIVFIVPITVFVFSGMLLSRLLHNNSFVKLFLFFICNVYLLLLLAPPFLQLDYFSYLFRLLGRANEYPNVRIFIYPSIVLLLSSSISFYFFKKNIRMFSLLLGVMSLAAVGLNMSSIISTIDAEAKDTGYNSLQHISFEDKKNIYFIVPDSYGSFSYMDENNIDVSKFHNYLSTNGFHLYDDVYSNYHTTLQSLSSMLNMQHHYYDINYKTNSTEVRPVVRRVITGNNNFVHLLRSNGYDIQYIHQSSYLLLHGSSADFFYPNISFAGGKTVLENIVPRQIRVKLGLQTKHKGVRLSEVQKKVVNLIDNNMKSKSGPFFQYIHSMRPLHPTGKNIQGTCNEAEELKRYSARVKGVNSFLTVTIDKIIARDPTAVIILSGDHGALIANSCKRSGYISTVSEYRSRCGVMMAIRWPEGYDGRYDDRIKTSINVFRYVIASLSEDDTKILKTLEAEDTYVIGRKKDRNNILKIIKNGVPLVPPDVYIQQDSGLKLHVEGSKSTH
jgi:hypothetical protein